MGAPLAVKGAAVSLDTSGGAAQCDAYVWPGSRGWTQLTSAASGGLYDERG